MDAPIETRTADTPQDAESLATGGAVADLYTSLDSLSVSIDGHLAGCNTTRILATAAAREWVAWTGLKHLAPHQAFITALSDLATHLGWFIADDGEWRQR